MVSKSGLDLQRRDRSGPPRNLAPSDLFHVPAKPRQYRNSVPYLAAHGKCSRSRRLKTIRKALGAIIREIERQPPRQLGNVDGNPACLFISENICLQRVGLVGYAVDVHERLTVGVAHDIAARNLFDTLYLLKVSLSRFAASSLSSVPLGSPPFG